MDHPSYNELSLFNVSILSIARVLIVEVELFLMRVRWLLEALLVTFVVAEIDLSVLFWFLKVGDCDISGKGQSRDEPSCARARRAITTTEWPERVVRLRRCYLIF